MEVYFNMKAMPQAVPENQGSAATRSSANCAKAVTKATTDPDLAVVYFMPSGVMVATEYTSSVVVSKRTWFFWEESG